MGAEQDGVLAADAARKAAVVSAGLRTLPPPCWEHHKPPNVTPSGKTREGGRLCWLLSLGVHLLSVGGVGWGDDFCLKPEKY